MSGKKKKKEGLVLAAVLSLLAGAGLVAAISLAGGTKTETGTDSHAITKKISEGVKHIVTRKVSETVMEQAVKQALESSGDPQAAEKAKEIVDDMDETDKQKAEEIIDRYADSDTFSDVMEIVGNGVDGESLSAVKDYLKENISEEDQAKLRELYEKYSQLYEN